MVGFLLLDHFSFILEDFARAGGGGSGGGSGGSGGGGILAVIAMIGYFPMYGLGKALRAGYYKFAWTVLQVIGWVVAGLIALALLIAAGMSGQFVLAFYVFLPIAIGALLGMGGGLYDWFTKLKQSKQVASALRAAEKKDYNWNEKKLKKYAEGIFLKFQQDWSNFDTESMGRYLSPEYHQHITLMMHALNGAHRVNRMTDVRINKSVIVDAEDSDNNDNDMFTLGITATAKDQLIDTRTSVLLFQDKNSFTEYWHFIRRGNDWILQSIEQSTLDPLKTSREIRSFAKSTNQYYSPDWGWLLLPVDGYLFSKGRFGTSDINNHVIGYTNNILTQLYTYEPVHVKTAGVVGDQYLVMQTNVPKTYGRILVKRRSGLINWPVKGLTKVQMEWGDFNKMYDVYASDLEKVTSFELLNPAFMAHLHDLPFEVNIEVVDNVVYIFTKANMSISNYKALYDILLKAHKEMKL